MLIKEIFNSIQGEGFFLGTPAIFIRTMGCNLKCPFCDTKVTWSSEENNKNCDDLTLDEIVWAAENYKTSLVVITGGEPCIQKDLPELVDRLKKVGKFVSIETNGTQPTPKGANFVTCSPKAEADYYINPKCKFKELKYVVTDTFDPVVIPEKIRDKYTGLIWLQPDGYNMQAMWQKAYDIAQSDDRLRVGIQLHKLMEVR